MLGKDFEEGIKVQPTQASEPLQPITQNVQLSPEPNKTDAPLPLTFDIFLIVCFDQKGTTQLNGRTLKIRGRVQHGPLIVGIFPRLGNNILSGYGLQPEDVQRKPG